MTDFRSIALGEFLKVRHGKSQRDVEMPTGRFPILGTGGQIGRTDTPLYSRPSVLIGRKGTIDRPQFLESPFWTVDTLFYTEIDPILADPKYVYYQFLTIPWASFNEASGVPSLSSRRVEQVKVPLPDVGTQRRIASVLSETDELISSLERLIGKKEAIKQGLTQQLLTGKTRLPGFDGEWAQTSMGESGLFSGAGVDKTSNTGEPPVRLLNYVDVYREEFVSPDTPRQMVTASTVKQRQCDIQAGDVFFTPTSETPDDIGRSAVSLQDAPGAVYSYHLVRWRPRDCWDPIFLGFAFNAEFFRSQVVALASGSGARYVLSIPGFRSLKISQPPVEEQAAIGRVLRDSSIQIEILTNRLTKVRSIKQGMMQELLTGRTRLLPAGNSV